MAALYLDRFATVSPGDLPPSGELSLMTDLFSHVNESELVSVVTAGRSERVTDVSDYLLPGLHDIAEQVIRTTDNRDIADWAGIVLGKSGTYGRMPELSELQSTAALAVSNPKYHWIAEMQSGWDFLLPGKLSYETVYKLKANGGFIAEDRGWRLWAPRAVVATVIDMLAKLWCVFRKGWIPAATNAESLGHGLISPDQGRGELVAGIVTTILPVPADNVPIEKILEFRTEHRQDLAELRRHLRELEAEVAAMPDAYSESGDVATGFRLAVGDFLEEISAWLEHEGGLRKWLRSAAIRLPRSGGRCRD